MGPLLPRGHPSQVCGHLKCPRGLRPMGLGAVARQMTLSSTIVTEVVPLSVGMKPWDLPTFVLLLQLHVTTCN